MICANQAMLAQCFPFFAAAPPVLVDWLPWSHTFGSNHNFGIALTHGGTFYFDAGRPTPGGIGETVANLKEIAPTVYFNVPKGFEALLPYLEADAALRAKFFSRLKMLFYAGAGLAPETFHAYRALARRATGRDMPFVTGLGATENLALRADACLIDVDEPANMGHPMAGVELKLAPLEGKLEARVRAPTVTPGYWRDNALTRAAFDEEGFYRFGDGVRFATLGDAAGGFLFDGRIAEDFKLATGTWVSVGPLRAALVSALAPLARDAAIAGHDRDDATALIFPDPDACRTGDRRLQTSTILRYAKPFASASPPSPPKRRARPNASRAFSSSPRHPSLDAGGNHRQRLAQPTRRPATPGGGRGGALCAALARSRDRSAGGPLPLRSWRRCHAEGVTDEGSRRQGRIQSSIIWPVEKIEARAPRGATPNPSGRARHLPPHGGKGRTHAVAPASTVITAPVMFRPPSPISSEAIAATSSGSASRRSALRAATAFAAWAPSSAMRQLGGDEARRDRVDSDADPADLARQRASEASQRRFGGGVDREPVEAGGRDDRRNVDDPPAPVRHHAAHDMFREHDRRQRVQPQQALDIAIAHRREQAFAARASVVDEAVERTAALAQGTHESRNGGNVGEIERLEMQRPGASQRAGRCSEGLARLARQAGHRDPIAGEAHCDREANAAARAGD